MSEGTMKCPYCGNHQTEVVETRDKEELETIRRRRSCVACGKRFTTYERIENVDLYVMKKDGRRELFNREKLKRGMITSTEKTKISVETVEKMLTDIERELRSRDSVEVKSKEIGEMVAKRLKKLDKVAYIRFASVFKRFVDVEDFEKEVKKLIK
ncbi:MAG TPA: transcriptional regulator NrdR [Patescibacteria group bacterium]|nr:transcriptional regulator NrdR [Patescibacteria group bacterium]